MDKFAEIIRGDVPVLVDFFATWCGPCKMMHPVLEDLKKQVGDKIKILKIDIDRPVNRPVVAKYGVQSVPTLILFKGNEVLWRQSGALPVAQLKTVVEKYL